MEENFRKLDRQLREKIAGWHGGKGELLDDVRGNRETISGSDQGKSFRAFYDFLLSQARQEELSGLLDSVYQLTAITGKDPRLRHIHYDWLDAAERTQATVRQLSEQLRRFLDDQVWFENRRVIDILRDIEARALRVRDLKDVPVSMQIDASAPAITLPMERPLYAPVRKARIDSENVRPADTEADPTALFEQVYVDPEPLRGCVRQALRKKLAEFDAQGGDTRLMLTRDQIAEMMRVFMPATSNEARLADKINSYISKAADLGFLRAAKNAEAVYEVRRILKAFVDAQWLADFDARLAAYAVLARGDDGASPWGDSIPPDPPGRPPREDITEAEEESAP